MERALCQDNRLRVVGIAGPGEPLANAATLKTLRLVHQHFPNLLLCLSTNGLTLADHLPELLDCGISSLTITVNSLTVHSAKHIYHAVAGSTDTDAISTFLTAQQEGVAKAVTAGVAVKINTVVIPGVNTDEIEEIARWAGRVGVSVMNLMPLIPQAAFQGVSPPSQSLLCDLRAKAGTDVSQFTHCKQCRTDAAGFPGELKGTHYR